MWFVTRTMADTNHSWVASAIGTTDFVTWEFIPLSQPRRVLAENITLTANEINLMRFVGRKPWW
ncbi:MAG TPA: hypothetical protein VIJ75_10450 [Hanamia sp.]